MPQYIFSIIDLVGLTSRRPNVLFIVIDDLQPSLGCYGGPIISPNIDQLAAQSAVFTNAMVQQAVCAPSRTSFLTGRRPDTTRLYDFGSYWRTHAGNYTTIPQHFKDNGYITLSVGKVFHPGAPSGMTDDYPYSWTLPAYQPSTQSYSDAKVCPGIDGNLYDNAMCPVDVDKMPEKTLPDLQTLEITENLIKILSPKPKRIKRQDAALYSKLEAALHPHGSTSRRSKRAPVVKLPFFLAVGFRKPHLPWKYPKDFQNLYPLESVKIAPDPNIPENLPTVAWETFKQLRERDDIKALNLSFPFGTIPLEYHASMRQNYYAATSFTDYLVGRLLQALEDWGHEKNTIISIVGDHGYQLGDHGEWCKTSNYHLATRAPLILHVPGVTDRDSFASRKFPLIDPLSPSFQSNLYGNRIKEATLGTGKSSSIEHHQTINKIDSRFDGNNLKVPKNIENQTRNEEFKSAKSFRLDTGRRKLLSQNKIDEFVEFVDLFPTLANLAGLPVPPLCPPNPFNVTFCSEGYSFAPLLQKVAYLNNRDIDHERHERCQDVTSMNFSRWKNATFSQYPRPSIYPTKKTDLPPLDLIKIMGYSMRTERYHYTEWIGFDHITFQGNWSDVKARELYLNDGDPRQDNNVANEKCYHDLIENLSLQLRRGWRDSLPVFRTGS
ncbi:iduronate 2-sulfatase-like [Lytechinus variegatus]|uniref:iduronate 2-sulfatase-like n=1 Tax=Lytechinus variegatus TaxID=7654 RepID=UPI001BB20ED4|nr:iduronate 2-sulfatase-like [Lytechinus variegatus]